MEYGYDEYLCVQCVNSATGTTGTLGNNFRVKQKMNCAIALKAATNPLQNEKHLYVSTTSKLIVANSWKSFFVNTADADCPNDAAITCEFKSSGCGGTYSGYLSIDPSSG